MLCVYCKLTRTEQKGRLSKHSFFSLQILPSLCSPLLNFPLVIVLLHYFCKLIKEANSLWTEQQLKDPMCFPYFHKCIVRVLNELTAFVQRSMISLVTEYMFKLCFMNIVVPLRWNLPMWHGVDRYFMIIKCF